MLAKLAKVYVCAPAKIDFDTRSGEALKPW